MASPRPLPFFVRQDSSPETKGQNKCSAIFGGIGFPLSAIVICPPASSVAKTCVPGGLWARTFASRLVIACGFCFIANSYHKRQSLLCGFADQPRLFQVLRLHFCLSGFPLCQKLEKQSCKCFIILLIQCCQSTGTVSAFC